MPTAKEELTSLEHFLKIYRVQLENFIFSKNILLFSNKKLRNRGSKMDFKTSKILGGVGALLMFIGGIMLFVAPFYYGIIEIVGIIFVLISLYGLANFYKNKGIFTNALFGVLASIVGAITATAVMVVVVLSSLENFLYQIFPNWNGDISSLQDLTPSTNIDFSAVSSFINGLLLVLVVCTVFMVITAFFVRRSLKDLTTHSGTGTFATAGMILLIGALLTILLVGLLLIWIATLLLAVAFFTMKEPEPIPTSNATTTTTIPPSTTSSV